MSGIVIEQNNATGAVSFWQGPDHQSVADRNGVSLADYIHAMYGFLRQAKSLQVLLIGGGGGTLATMLDRAGVSVTMVDINPAAFDIARRYFNLPDSVECHVADGVAFLRRATVRYDAIVLDAYSGGGVPAPFLKTSFYKLARSRMAARGAIFLSNLHAQNDADRYPDKIARVMRRTWRAVRIHDCDGYVDRNVVVVAGAVRNLEPPRLMMRPQRGANAIAKNLAELTFRRLR
jgi:spermidine synthase